MAAATEKREPVSGFVALSTEELVQVNGGIALSQTFTLSSGVPSIGSGIGGGGGYSAFDLPSTPSYSINYISNGKYSGVF